jgi:hypothetical protein
LLHNILDLSHGELCRASSILKTPKTSPENVPVNGKLSVLAVRPEDPVPLVRGGQLEIVVGVTASRVLEHIIYVIKDWHWTCHENDQS